MGGGWSSGGGGENRRVGESEGGCGMHACLSVHERSDTGDLGQGGVALATSTLQELTLTTGNCKSARPEKGTKQT